MTEERSIRAWLDSIRVPLPVAIGAGVGAFLVLLGGYLQVQSWFEETQDTLSKEHAALHRDLTWDLEQIGKELRQQISNEMSGPIMDIRHETGLIYSQLARCRAPQAGGP